MENINNKKVNSVIDITKFILSLFVDAIHAGLAPNILYPWLRIAVPLFFMISSYFFFCKINKCHNIEHTQKILKNFIKRNLTLYAFWFVVLLPITIDIRGWFIKYNVIKSVKLIIRGLLFSSTFRASWFIMALVISVTIIYYASKIISSKVLLILCILIYTLICFRSSYFFMVASDSFLYKIINLYDIYLTPAYNSFPVALLWIVLGKIFADSTFKADKKNKIICFIFLITSMIALYLEWRIVKKHSNLISNDCYIMLIPVSAIIFYFIITANPFTINHSLFLRKCSTIIFVLHCSILHIINKLFKILHFSNTIIAFLFTIVICISICILILFLERKEHFKWLKYSY